MAARYLVPALAVAGRAIAQSSCSTSATLTIQNQGDATGIASCPSYDGSIAIAEGTTGSIDLSGVGEITGDLVVNNATMLTNLMANTLTTIGGDFILQGLTLLSTLTFPALEDVVGKIDFTTLPDLQALQFTNQVKTAGTLKISSTNLYSLTGINLERVGSVEITENSFLNDITMQLANVSGPIVIGNNGADASCNVTFPNLIWAESLNIMNVQQLFIPSLQSTNMSLYLSQNVFTSLSAPNLTTVGADLSFDSNSGLTNISVPLLTAVTGGLTVTSNDDLEKINQFNALKSVGGAVTISGAADEIDFPALMDVKGAFNATSTKDISSSCKTFKNENGPSKVIKGKLTCPSTSPSSTSSSGGSGGSSGTGSNGSGASTSSGAANPVFITGATGLLGVVAAIFGML